LKSRNTLDDDMALDAAVGHVDLCLDIVGQIGL
jgi:hypothetical protein